MPGTLDFLFPELRGKNNVLASNLNKTTNGKISAQLGWACTQRNCAR